MGCRKGLLSAPASRARNPQQPQIAVHYQKQKALARAPGSSPVQALPHAAEEGLVVNVRRRER